MDKQQATVPIISNATILDRMFRAKPYTKCFECLRNTRLKCKKCMESILDEIEKKNQPRNKTTIGFLSNVNSSHQKFKSRKMKSRNNTYRAEEKENQSQLVLMSKYDKWMQVTKKRQGMEDCTLSKWPRKMRLNDKNLQKYGIKQPKFQKWEKKLLDQLVSKTVKL